MDLKGKKLLILGGIDLSCEIIKQAKQLGVYVIVTDYLEDSPGKKIADKSFMISTTDVESIVNLIKKEKIDGVLTGFIDSMLPYYQEICEKAGLPCYVTKEQIEIVINKNKFKELCRTFNVPTVEEYQYQFPFLPNEINRIEYPVIIKPVDNSGGRGIYICENKEDFLINYKKSLAFSPSKKIIIERYMAGTEVTIFYVIQDGEIYLSAMADRYTKNRDGVTIPLPVAYIFPSQYLFRYQEELNSRVIEMFKSIGLNNGMLFIQAFVENGKCVFYEMGYRLTGSLEYKIIADLNKINPMQMMISYALTGAMFKNSIKNVLQPNYKYFGCNITYLAKPGKLGEVKGLDRISALDGVLDLVQTYKEGDIIPESAIGTLKQVILRVFVTSKTKKDLACLIDKIHGIIKVISNNGEDMLLDVFDTQELLG